VVFGEISVWFFGWVFARFPAAENPDFHRRNGGKMAAKTEVKFPHENTHIVTAVASP